MRQPITILMRQYASRFILARTVVLSVFFLFIMLISFTTNAPVIIWLLWCIIFGMAYIIIFVSYFRIRDPSLSTVVIDEQGIYSGRLFIPWDSIAAICPCRLGLFGGECIGIFPKDLRRILRQSSFNAGQRIGIGMLIIKARLLRRPLFILRPDDRTVQDLLQQMWDDYQVEYERHRIYGNHL